MDFKALAHKLERVGDGQFATAWSYRCEDHAIEEVFKDAFFNPTAGNLIPGDTINVSEMKDGSVTAFCSLMVVSKPDAKNVICRPMTREIVRFETREPAPHRAIVKDGPKFIKGDGIVNWNPGRKKHIVTVQGTEIGAFKNKDEAVAVARGDMPLPV